ncbi:hypothetical protein [Clostridium fallax]|uniref:Uncharacterized protein n=1 Tax=Clostridium fallax TaxID=1533 RepID=A0A1M4SZQ5_9CLOT|nr:hypothetical protein [Clostridium fallax]SHE37600.1 hypothetical protein SAMN05443638_101254 [Clostridium fallax]SQB08049.1 Uncharacterised protein [Clostridium fallax]
MSNGTKYSISISNGIYSVAKDKKVALTQGTEQQFNDTQAPTLVSANQDVEKDNTIDLVFNEPVSSIGGLKIDGKTVIKKAININYKDNTITNEDGAVDNVTITNEAGNYKVKVTLPETMSKDTINKITALGNHNVIAYNVADTCASMQNTAVTLTTQYDVTVNALTPEVTNVKADEDNDREFYIEFNKDIDINTVQPGNLTVKKGDVKYNQATTPTITVEGWDMDNNVATAVGKTNVKAIKVTIGADTDDYKLYKDDEKSVNLSVKLENYKTSAGYIGDKFKGNVTLSKDAAGPQIKLDQCELNNTAKPNEAAKYEGINVVFNKAVTNVQPSKINVTDKNGITRTVKTATSNNTDTVTIKLADFTSNDYSNKAPFTVTFEDGAVQKYVAGAVESPVYNSEQQVTVYDESTVTPELLLNENDVDSHINTVDGIVTNIITINYRKEMSATAVDLNNYTLDGQALPKGTKISMGADNKTVTITLPEGSISENATNMFVISKNVKTVEGSVVVGKLTNHQAFNKAIELKDSVKPTLESAEYVLIDNANDKATNMIRVKFSENLLNNLQENGKELDGKNVTAEAAKANIAKAITNFKIKVNNNDQTIATIGRFDNNANTLDIVLSNEVKIDSNSVISVVPVGTDDNAAMFISDEAGNTLAQNGDDVKVSGTEQGNASEIAAIKAQQEVEAKAAAQVKVNAIASAITKVDAPAVDANKLKMPNVPDGYTIAIKSSSNEGVIAKNGTITPPDDATSVKLVFTVTNTATKAEADTQEITVEVPASQAKAAAKEEAAKQEAAKKANQKSVDDAKSEVKNIELTKGSKLTEDKKTDVENAIKAKLTDKDITVKAEKVDDNNYKVTLTKGADKTEGTTTIAKVPVTVAS